MKIWEIVFEDEKNILFGFDQHALQPLSSTALSPANERFIIETICHGLINHCRDAANHAFSFYYISRIRRCLLNKEISFQVLFICPNADRTPQWLMISPAQPKPYLVQPRPTHVLPVCFDPQGENQDLFAVLQGKYIREFTALQEKANQLCLQQTTYGMPEIPELTTDYQDSIETQTMLTHAHLNTLYAATDQRYQQYQTTLTTQLNAFTAEAQADAGLSAFIQSHVATTAALAQEIHAEKLAAAQALNSAKMALFAYHEAYTKKKANIHFLVHTLTQTIYPLVRRFYFYRLANTHTNLAKRKAILTELTTIFQNKIHFGYDGTLSSIHEVYVSLLASTPDELKQFFSSLLSKFYHHEYALLTKALCAVETNLKKALEENVFTLEPYFNPVDFVWDNTALLYYAAYQLASQQLSDACQQATTQADQLEQSCADFKARIQPLTSDWHTLPAKIAAHKTYLLVLRRASALHKDASRLKIDMEGTSAILRLQFQRKATPDLSSDTPIRQNLAAIAVLFDLLSDMVTELSTPLPTERLLSIDALLAIQEKEYHRIKTLFDDTLKIQLNTLRLGAIKAKYDTYLTTMSPYLVSVTETSAYLDRDTNATITRYHATRHQFEQSVQQYQNSRIFPATEMTDERFQGLEAAAQSLAAQATALQSACHTLNTFIQQQESLQEKNQLVVAHPNLPVTSFWQRHCWRIMLSASGIAVCAGATTVSLLTLGVVPLIMTTATLAGVALSHAAATAIGVTGACSISALGGAAGAQIGKWADKMTTASAATTSTAIVLQTLHQNASHYPDDINREMQPLTLPAYPPAAETLILPTTSSPAPRRIVSFK